MALKTLIESRVAEKEELIFRAFDKNFYKSFTKKGLCGFNNPHFLAFFGLFSCAFLPKMHTFEQKLIDVSGSQRIIYFLADLHLTGTRAQFAVSIHKEI